LKSQFSGVRKKKKTSKVKDGNIPLALIKDILKSFIVGASVS
jgi:hypothetical protein